MQKGIYILLFAMFLVGCVAFVNEGSEGRKVKSFIISREEAIDILDQTNQQTPDKEFEVKLPDKLQWPSK